MKTSILTCILCAAVAVSCTKEYSPAQALTDARIELDDRNFTSARDILDRLMADSTKMSSMNVKQLVTAAQLYTTMAMQDSDSSSETDEASAARCLTRARDIDPDSVDEYVNSLAAEAAHHLRTISAVSTYLNANRDSLVTDEEPDSVM